MARATKLYIVLTGEPDSEIVIGFTVKHEAVSWLERYSKRVKGPGEPSMANLWVTTTNDGSQGNQTTVSAWEFLSGNL